MPVLPPPTDAHVQQYVLPGSDIWTDIFAVAI